MRFRVLRPLLEPRGVLANPFHQHRNPRLHGHPHLIRKTLRHFGGYLLIRDDLFFDIQGKRNLRQVQDNNLAIKDENRFQLQLWEECGRIVVRCSLNNEKHHQKLPSFWPQTKIQSWVDQLHPLKRTQLQYFQHVKIAINRRRLVDWGPVKSIRNRFDQLL